MSVNCVLELHALADSLRYAMSVKKPDHFFYLGEKKGLLSISVFGLVWLLGVIEIECDGKVVIQNPKLC